MKTELNSWDWLQQDIKEAVRKKRSFDVCRFLNVSRMCQRI